MGGIALIIILGELDQVQKSFLIVAITIGLMLASGRIVKFIPASLVALVVITVALPFVGALLEEVRIGPLALNSAIDYIGRIPESIPTLEIPDLGGSTLLTLLLPALSIALLGSIDSLLTSVVMDNITGGRHRSNKELIGQGLGNIASGLFGGMASAGATVRSVVNIRSGGRTALSAATHSVVLLTLVAGLSGVVQYIPLAVLSGILILTAVGMFDWETMRKAHVAPRGDVVVLFATMAITVLVDLTVAVAVGVALALIVHAVQARQRKATIAEDGSATYRIRGPLSFLSADHVFSSLRNGHSTLSLNLKDVHYVDMSGAKALLTFIDHSEKAGVDVGLEEVPAHIEKRLVALANPAQYERLKTTVEPA
ncbi:SulP family inorganic anion transporter [Nocardia sp. CDC159]|uniref:SulP family inorganic anion transporter n=2 Tax=Nocardiaceae TaxID=85025 RepID=A0A9X2J1P2_9NOCA|nr:SulP family inorganic anion transporter [Nocardia pulmonis]MCM6791969.1 SulP family inorganic anion transporter [Nocardia sp. CDC159]